MNRKEKDKIRLEQRVRRYTELRGKLERSGYASKDVIIKGRHANFFAIALCLPFLAIITIYYLLNYYGSPLIQPPVENTALMIGILLVGIIGSFLVHELLHGIGWCLAGGFGWKAIRFSSGHGMIMCHCDEPMTGKQYLVGALTPFVVLGLGWLVAALIFPGYVQMLMALVCITMAGGDLLISQRMLKYRNDIILDHPKEAGFTAFYRVADSQAEATGYLA